MVLDKSAKNQEKDNNTKAPSMEKIQKSQVTQEPTQLFIWIYEVC
jgi:hypothetical protein